MKFIAPLLAVILIFIGFVYLQTQVTDSSNKYNKFAKECLAKNGIPFVAEKQMLSERVECYAYKLENK